MALKIYKSSDQIGDENSRKFSSFQRKNGQKNQLNSYQKFARKENDFQNKQSENNEEKFISYDDFYEKNGRDLPFGNSSFSRKKSTNLSPKEYYEKQKIRREKIAKKLADEKNLRENLANGNLENEEFLITKISPAAKTAGRYNVFVNDKFSFSLDEVQLVNSGLKKGKVLSSEEYLSQKNDSDFGKNYVRALDLISRRIRSEKEIRDYGFKKKWSENATEKVIERLYERGYLNDEKFAKSFVDARANLRNFSKRKMEIELIKKGIEKEIREQILCENENFDESESLKNMVAKKWNRYENDQKLIAYLARQGFNFDDIKNAIKEFREENANE